MIFDEQILSKGTIKILNEEKIIREYHNSKPFPHLIIENFLDKKIANRISDLFPNYNEQYLHNYSNAIEEKKVTNDWNKFPKDIYSTFLYLCSERFTALLRRISGAPSLQADLGLHGGGIHMHKRGGKLNAHLDYSIHPKVKLQRKLNILLYLTPNWQKEWGGELCFFENSSNKVAGKLLKKIEPIFNRAVIFDVTKNSWHGLPKPINCPHHISRNSLAVYYLQIPDNLAVQEREKALFIPAEWQRGDVNIENLCKDRSKIDKSKEVYITKKNNENK